MSPFIIIAHPTSVYFFFGIASLILFSSATGVYICGPPLADRLLLLISVWCLDYRLPISHMLSSLPCMA